MPDASVHLCWMCGTVQEPDLDASVAEDLQGGPDVGLQLILHPGQTQQLHLHLQTLNHRGYLQGAVVDTQLGLDVPGLGAGEQRAITTDSSRQRYN